MFWLAAGAFAGIVTGIAARRKPYVISVYFQGDYLGSVPHSSRALRQLRRQFVATEKKRKAAYKQTGIFSSKSYEIVFDIQWEKK
ncbi:MAG: hypothetical protein IBX61_07465 [Thermoleophilia bacterium]|nr:hypothetical protein [Thermoleophilia bacterium]